MRVITILAMLFWSAGLLAQQTSVEVFELQHRLADDLVPVVAPLAAQEGVVRATGNSLIVRATPQAMADIRKVLAQIDTSPRQLLISVRQGADLLDTRQSASVTGRVGGENGRVIVQPRQREDANVIVGDGQGNVFRGGLSDSSSRNQRNTTQQVRVLEGSSALIQVGQQRPVVQRRVFPSVGRPVVIEEPGFQEAITGFRVRPRVQGDQFTLMVSPQQASFRDAPNRAGNVVDVQRLTTSVSGPLGQWVDIGGAISSQSTQNSGLASRSSSQSSTNTSVLIKVEVLP